MRFFINFPANVVPVGVGVDVSQSSPFETSGMDIKLLVDAEHDKDEYLRADGRLPWLPFGA